MKFNKLIWIVSLVLLLSVGFVSADIDYFRDEFNDSVVWINLDMTQGETKNITLHNSSFTYSPTSPDNIFLYYNNFTGGDELVNGNIISTNYLNKRIELGEIFNPPFTREDVLIINSRVQDSFDGHIAMYIGNATEQDSAFDGINWRESAGQDTTPDDAYLMVYDSGTLINLVDGTFEPTEDVWYRKSLSIYENRSFISSRVYDIGMTSPYSFKNLSFSAYNDDFNSLQITGYRISNSVIIAYESANDWYRLYGRNSGYIDMDWTGTYIRNGTVEDATISCNSNECNITANTDLVNYAVPLNTDLTGNLNVNVKNNNFSVSVIDFWDDSNVDNITVKVNGTTYTNTTGNTITTTLLNNDSSTYLVEVYANNYIGKNYTNLNISNDLITKLYQSDIVFSVSEYITNNIIDGGWCTVNTTSQNCNESFYLSEGTYNVTFNKTGYFNKTVEFTVSALDIKTVNISDIFGVLINITPKDIFSNDLLSNFTGWLYDIDNNINMSFNTLDTNYTLPGINSTNYFLSVSPNGYTTSTNNFTSNATYMNVSTYHYLYNSFYVTFRDEVNNSIVNNVSLDLISDLYSNNYSTTNGTMYVSALTPEGYTLRYTSDNYTNRFYYLDVIDDSAFNITLYLKEEGTAVDTTIIVYDTSSSSNLEGAVVKVQRYDLSSNSYKVVQMGTTDSDGEVIFDIVQDSEFYKFIVLYNDVVVKITTPQAIDKTIIKIPVTIGSSFLQTYSTYKDIIYSLDYNKVTNNFRFLFDDPTGVSRSYCLYLYSEAYDAYTLVNTSCVSSSSGTLLLPVTPINGTTYTAEAYVTISGDKVFLTKDSVTFKNDSFGDNGLLLQLLLSLLFISSGFIFVEAIPIALPLSLIVGGLFYFHSIPLYFTFPLLVLGIIVSFWVGKNG